MYRPICVHMCCCTMPFISCDNLCILGECSSIPDALMKGQWLDRYDGALTWVAEYSKGLYMQKVAGADTIVTAGKIT